MAVQPAQPYRMRVTVGLPALSLYVDTLVLKARRALTTGQSVAQLGQCMLITGAHLATCES